MPAGRASMTEPLILDRYRLVERLAVGGSAEVWRAHDEQLERPVAVKRLHPHLVPDEASRRRLVAEARAAGGLTHPVIVAVYDVDADSEAPAIVMELVEGQSLAARLARSGPLTARDAALLTADLADALFHAHKRGVIHRDVKPGNVLLADDGRVRLVDFGIARVLAESAERLTLTGTVVGTLSAMAPEQLAGAPVTPRTDLYGLGVVLYEALMGRPPYSTASPIALAEAQRAGLPPLDGVDEGLVAIVAACLAHDPEDRPLHAGALAEALRGWAGGAATTAVGIVPPPPPAPAERPAAAAGPRLRPRVQRRLAISAALVAVAMLVAALFLGIGRQREAAAVDPAASAATAAPSPSASSSAPAWLAGLIAKIGEECGADVAAEVEGDLVAMDEGSAEEYADALEEECGGSGDGSDKGNGRGNGNSNGRGNGGGGNNGRGNGG